MKVRRIGRVRLVTKKLWNTGAYPSAVFGHQTMGTPPSTLLAMRRDAAAAVAGRRRAGVSIRCCKLCMARLTLASI
eukprot:4563495-Pyramimonas_sp.AAC.1